MQSPLHFLPQPHCAQGLLSTAIALAARDTVFREGKAQIIDNRQREGIGLLKHHTDLTAQRCRIVAGRNDLTPQ